MPPLSLLLMLFIVVVVVVMFFFVVIVVDSDVYCHCKPNLLLHLAMVRTGPENWEKSGENEKLKSRLGKAGFPIKKAEIR